MKKKTLKLIALIGSAIMLVAITVGVTVAYLTDDAKVINTFTVGNVQISLDEADYNDETDEVNGGRTEKGNKYRLIPGHTYPKDPTVTVMKGSEDCYVRMKVKVEGLDMLKRAIPVATHPEYYSNGVFLLQNLCVNTTACTWDPDIWKYEDFTAGTDSTEGTYEFRYYKSVAKNDANDTPLEALFTEFTIPGFLTNEQIAYLKDVKLVVTAEAIQEDGFANADAAWLAFQH